MRPFATLFIKAALAAFIVMTSSSSAYASLQSDIVRHCKAMGCDSSLFYRYYEKHAPRFCEERATLLKQPVKAKALRQIAEGAMTRGLPPSVAVLPIMESSLNPLANQQYRQSAAKGLWQFKPAAARDMGLTVTPVLDERLDPVASTKAALRYLSWLSGKFDGDHNLAVLAYHAGIGRVQKTIKRSGVRNVWYLTRLFNNDAADQNYMLKYHAYTLALTGTGCEY
jgi:membrane-bound lytic murein transglycosylase MltF